MHRLHGSRTWKYVALYVAATMIVPYAVVSFPAVAEAQAQPVVESASVIVLPIRDTDGSIDSVLSQKATDALALAMEGSGQYSITSKMDLERELAALSLDPPLSIVEQMRLGERLAVDQVATGEITELHINERTGEATIGLSVGLLDVEIGEHLNGANLKTVTKIIPGWQGEESRVINDAVREIAELAVSELLRNRVEVGYVTSVNEFGVATFSLGHDDALQSGMEMMLLRPVWQRDLEQIMMVKVGAYLVDEVGARTSKMTALGEGRARIGDRVYRLYRGPERAEAEKRKSSHQQTITVALGLLALFGVVTVATGPSSDDAPVGVRSFLFQQAPGDEAVIRVSVPERSIPLEDQIFAWLFFRAETQNFSLMPDKLVGAVLESRLPNNVWDDGPEFETFEVEREFTFLTPEGDEEDGSIELLFHHWALQPGHTYFHRVQRVIEPIRRAGSGSPITTGQVVDLDDPEINVDPDEALSEGSTPTSGVTYFTPPVLQSPESGAQNQSTSSVTFTWNATLGANQYVLQVFPEDDPEGQRSPRYQAEIRQDTGGTMFYTINDTFASNSRFYWRVGARRTGEPLPVNRLGQAGWIFSDIRTFTTAAAPPPPPGTTGAGYQSGGQGTYPGGFNIPRYGHQTPGVGSRGINR